MLVVAPNNVVPWFVGVFKGVVVLLIESLILNNFSSILEAPVTLGLVASLLIALDILSLPVLGVLSSWLNLVLKLLLRSSRDVIELFVLTGLFCLI